MPIELIAPQTAAANGEKRVAGVYQQQPRAIPQTLIGVGLQSGDTINVQITHDGGTTWENMFQDGSQVQLTSTNNVMTLYGPLTYRVSKGVTTGEAGCYLATAESP